MIWFLDFWRNLSALDLRVVEVLAKLLLCGEDLFDQESTDGGRLREQHRESECGLDPVGQGGKLGTRSY